MATFDRLLRDALWGRRVPAPVDATAERIGAWIRACQAPVEAQGTLSLDERRTFVDDRLGTLVNAGVVSAADRSQMLNRFDDLAREVRPALEPLVAIHGDLRPTNILVSADGRVTVLDSAIGKTGTRFHDLAHLYMHLEFLRWRPRLKSGIVGDVQHALLRGYDAAVSASDPLFVLMLLHHIVCHIAALTEHPARRVDPAHRWFVRRRWAKCSRVAGLGLKERSPKTAYTGTAVS